MASLSAVLEANAKADELLRNQGIPTTREESQNPARFRADLFFERHAVHSFRADKYTSLKERAEDLNGQIKALRGEQRTIRVDLDRQINRISPFRRDGDEPALTEAEQTAITALRVDAEARSLVLFEREENCEHELDPILQDMSLVHGELNSADLCVDDSGISLFDEDSPMFHELDQITQLAESGAIVLTETERKILDTLWKIRENPANLDLYREDLFPKEGERSALLSGEFKGGVFDGLKSLFTKVKFNGTVRVKVFSEHEIALVKEANDNKPRNPGWNGALRREEIESIRRSYRSASFGAKSVEEDLHLAHVRALKLSQEEGSLKEDFELI